MNRRIIWLISLFSFLSIVVNAQFEIPEEDVYPETNQNIGFGMGLEYGGLGGRVVLVTSSYVDLFGGVGFNFNGAGFNAGLSYRITPGKQYVPYLSAMYGYNAVIAVEGLDEYDKTYYGPTLGFGIQLHTKKKKKNYINAELLVPFRSSEFDRDFEIVENDPRVDIIAKPWPVLIGVGYHIGF